MRSSPPRNAEGRPARVEAPFTVPAVLLAMAGAGGMLAQSGLGEPLLAALGSPAPAVVAAVLALLLGTGLGARLARARVAAGRPPLVLLAAVLVVLAGVELVLPRAWGPLSRGPLALRALVGGALFLLPSVSTGLLLPLVARVTAREVGGSRQLSLLFAALLAGGSVGAAIAACVCAPARGLGTAVWLGAGITALAALLSFAASRAWSASGAPLAHRSRARARQGPSPLALASVAHGFLGGAALLLVVHVVRLANGSAADTLPAALVGALAGLAAGSAHTRTLLLHYRETAAARAIATSALVLAACMLVLGAVPRLALVMGTFLRTPPDTAALHVLVAIGALAFPAAWIGASFQLLLPHLAEGTPGDGAERAAGAGTAGATLGAAFAGIVLLPLLGSQRALAGTVVGFTALAVGMAWRGRARRSVVLTGVAGVVVLLLSPRWELARAALGRDAAAPAAWAREGVSVGIVATTTNGVMGMNGAVQATSPDDEALAQLAASLAPHLSSALAVDDLGLADALLSAPWEHVTVPRLAAAWLPHLPAPMRAAAEDPRALAAPGRGLAALPRGAADALVLNAPPGCGPGCARSFATAARDALAAGGVALFSVRDAEPLALAALLRATRDAFPHVAFAAFGARAAVVGGLGPLEAPAGRLEALAARARLPGASAATPAPSLVTGAAVDACAALLVSRRDASPAALRGCYEVRAAK